MVKSKKLSLLIAKTIHNQTKGRYLIIIMDVSKRLILSLLMHIMLYSQNIWQGIKFGDLAVYIITTAKFSYLHIYMYVWRSCTKPPNLNLLIFNITIAILGSATKFNFRQYMHDIMYFRLYRICSVLNNIYNIHINQKRMSVSCCAS